MSDDYIIDLVADELALARGQLASGLAPIAEATLRRRIAEIGVEGGSRDELDARFFTSVSPAFEGADFQALFSAEQALAARAGIGGTAPDAVAEQIAALRAIL
jgi:argininosuccinate lyase